MPSSYVEIPDLLFKGAKVYILQEDNSSTPVTPPTSIPSGPTIYPVAKLMPNVTHSTLPANIAADRTFLKFASSTYQQALRSLPGSHQLYFDMLVNSRGLLYSDAIPQPVGTARDATLKTQINWIINDTSYNGPLRPDPSYNGPLKAIYDALVAAKLGV